VISSSLFVLREPNPRLATIVDRGSETTRLVDLPELRRLIWKAMGLISSIPQRFV
jgi:hypothetical protein